MNKQKFCEPLLNEQSDFLELMTHSQQKTGLLLNDVYFREAYVDFYAHMGSEIFTFISRLTFVLFKPDGLVSRCVDSAISHLKEDGFQPIVAKPFRFNRFSMRELWRYQINTATLQRLAAIDLLLTATDSLFIIFVNTSTGEQSAAERLRQLKGPSQLLLRQQWHLRERLHARDGLLNYIHTPDDPADFIREIGVLFDQKERKELLTQLTDQKTYATSRIEETIAALYASIPIHDLNLHSALNHIETLYKEFDAEPLTSLLTEYRRTNKAHAIDWQKLFALLSRSGIEIPQWDRITIAAACTICDLKELQPIL